MQLVLHALLENQIVERNFGLDGGRGRDIAERDAVRGEAGEITFEIF